MEVPKIYPTTTRAWLDVNLGAIRRNAAALRARAGVPLIPMVKANAYGLGAIEIANALEQEAPLAYGVATVAEGAELRTAGIQRPIVIFTPILRQEFVAASRAKLTPTLSNAGDILVWSETHLPYHLAIDTGMNRAGASWRDLNELCDLANAVSACPPSGAFTHFHSAEADPDSVAEQEARFRSTLQKLDIAPESLHVDNSAAILRSAGQRGWHAVRPGIFLYGVATAARRGGDPEPEAVLALRARIVDLRWLAPGDTVSYGATYTASNRERIATVAVGYGDGYPRSLSNRGHARLRGRKVPLRGRVTMDMTMFDVTGVPCDVGDPVTLISDVKRARLDVATVAEAAEMSPYELLTGLSSRLARRYTDA